MATIPLVLDNSERTVRKATWLTIGDDDVGAPLGPPEHGIDYPDKSVHIHVPTWGAATLVIQGSNDGTNWALLHDPQGGDLSFTSAAGAETIVAIAENPLYIRPSTSGGTATDIDVVIAAHAAT